MTLTALVLLVASHSVGQRSTNIASVASSDGTTIRLSDESLRVIRTITSAAQVGPWSKDGTLLALQDAGLMILDTRTKDSEPVQVASKAEFPSWGPDGLLYFSVPQEGIKSANLKQKATLVVPDGRYPAPSPDGTELAFTTNGLAGGVWIARTNGEAARRVLRGKSCGQVTWSYNGRWLAAVVEGHLKLVRPSGRTVRDLGPVNDERIAWSGGSPYLLAKREGGWSYWDDLESKWVLVVPQAASMPQWLGPRRFLVLHDGKAIEQGSELTNPLDLGEKPILSVSQAVGSYLGQSFPDPFRLGRRPERGESALRGRVVSTDPIIGTVTLLVDSVTEASGKETVSATPTQRVVSVAEARLMRSLTVLPETSVRVVVRGKDVVDALVEDALETIAEPIIHRNKRPRLQTEFDGITREKIVRPLIYPIPGKHRFVDTFLAPRGGGTRRHHGNDLMAPKMTPLLAVWDGVVFFGRSNQPWTHNILSLQSDDGWEATYMHINNDTPATDDGRGSMRFAYPADLQPGDRVKAGEVVAWCGDSGNAEDTGPHLHIELYDEDGGAIIDPAYSFRAGKKLAEPLYTDPDPILKPVAGQIRWDGVVTAVDQTKRIVVIELCGVGAPNRAPKRNLAPRLAYLQINNGLTFRFRSESDLRYSLEAIRAGFRVSAIGAMAKEKMLVRSASFALANAQ